MHRITKSLILWVLFAFCAFVICAVLAISQDPHRSLHADDGIYILLDDEDGSEKLVLQPSVTELAACQAVPVLPELAALSVPQPQPVPLQIEEGAVSGANMLSAQLRVTDPELLILVNPWNEIPEDYTVELAWIEGKQVDIRCRDALAQMLSDCRSAGNDPFIVSAYRSQETQRSLHINRILRLMADGLDYDTAAEQAAHIVARPGTSEHQLGLAVDILDEWYQYMNKSQEDRPTQIWLMEHSWEYGFILRYPNDKSEITGIIYEPWHYRYVGTTAAKQIHDLGLCFEEYLALLGYYADTAQQESAASDAQHPVTIIIVPGFESANG